MDHPALTPLRQAIAALTYDEIEVTSTSFGVKSTTTGEEVPLLDRSIGQDLTRIESALSGKGLTLLSAIAASIDEALLAIEEATQLLQGKGA